VIRQKLIEAEKQAYEEMNPSAEWEQDEYRKALVAELVISLQIQVDPDIE